MCWLDFFFGSLITLVVVLGIVATVIGSKCIHSPVEAFLIEKQRMNSLEAKEEIRRIVRNEMAIEKFRRSNSQSPLIRTCCRKLEEE